MLQKDVWLFLCLRKQTLQKNSPGTYNEPPVYGLDFFFIFVCSRGLLELKMPVVSKTPSHLWQVVPSTWICRPAQYQHVITSHAKSLGEDNDSI